MKRRADKVMHKCLVIGYGNTLRRDDGVGVEVAQAIEEMNLPCVSVITRHQLVPELAAPISEADAVIFVDAQAGADGKAALHPIEPAQSSQLMAHAADPPSLLALAKQAFGGSPKAWTLAVPVNDFDFGFGLSRHTEKNLRGAVKMIRQFLTDLAKIA